MRVPLLLRETEAVCLHRQRQREKRTGSEQSEMSCVPGDGERGCAAEAGAAREPDAVAGVLVVCDDAIRN